jgi:hypothetical protein
MKDKELSELKPLEKRIFKALQRYKELTLDEAVENVVREEGIDKDEATKTIYLLWKKGYLDITMEQTPKNFLKYLFSIESIWFHIFIVIILITSLLVIFVEEPPLLYLRYIFGSLFILYLPGYSLIEVLYPRGDELEPLERMALSIGLSLALVPLVGLVLNYTPWGIRLTPILVSLVILTIALSSGALYRKYMYFRLQFEG